MGASGSGKSTLLKVLGGQLQPTQRPGPAQRPVALRKPRPLKRYVSYIPQEDAFDEHLTIGENLQFAAAIRSPHLSRRDRTRRLRQTDRARTERTARQHRRQPGEKNAQRRRAKTAQHRARYDRLGRRLPFRRADLRPVLERFRARHRDHPRDGAQQDHRRHDPPAELETFPDVSQGDPASTKAGASFSSARRPTCCAISRRRNININSAPTSARAHPAARRGRNSFSMCSRRRCAISAATSSTRRTIAGNSSPARRYSPEFWRDKYEAFRLIQDVKQVSLRREPVPALPAAPAKKKRDADSLARRMDAIAHAPAARFHEQAAQSRAISSSRSASRRCWPFSSRRILRYSDSGTYDFASAYHIPTFLFLSLIVAMFLWPNEQRGRYHLAIAPSCSANAISTSG